MTAAAQALEAADDRIRRLLPTEPVISSWLADGAISVREAELLYILAESTERGHPVRVVLPGRTGLFAVLAAVLLATRPLTHPGSRQPRGPVALVGVGPRHRRALETLRVGGSPVLEALRTVRARRDGLVQRWSGGTARPLGAEDRLLLVSNRVGTPELGGLGPVVVDHAGAGGGYETLHAWAAAEAGVLHVVAELDPAAGPSGYSVDWPLLAADPSGWPGEFSDAWAASPETVVHRVAPEPAGLREVRKTIGALARQSTDVWPPQIRNVAALTRQLAGLAVPPAAYDSATHGTIALPIAERAELLAATRSSHLPNEWRAFAETSWASLKEQALAAVDSLEGMNPKAETLGLTVERLLSQGERLHVWVDSDVHARAVARYLLTSGFAVEAAAFDDGRLRVSSLNSDIRPSPEGLSILTALPAQWHLPRVCSADFGGPMHALCYRFEEDRLESLLRWIVNGSRLESAHLRGESLRAALGAVSVPEPPAELTVRLTAEGAAVTLSTPDAREWVDDAAEFAALATDEWLRTLPGEHPADLAGDIGSSATAYGFLVEPGPAVLFIRSSQLVDRLVGGRLRPTPPAAVRGGALILGIGGDSRSLFDRLRPHLDDLQGPGTRLCLDQWDEALRDAVEHVGSPEALAAALVADGAAITAPAVAMWASPYRIGPRDPSNVERVAAIADHAFVRHHAGRVAAVMAGVRVEHHRLSRAIARAIRRHAAGEADAFDELENRLRTDVAEILGDLTTYRVVEPLGVGLVAARYASHLVSPSQARDLFTPQET